MIGTDDEAGTVSSAHKYAFAVTEPADGRSDGAALSSTIYVFETMSKTSQTSGAAGTEDAEGKGSPLGQVDASECVSDMVGWTRERYDRVKGKL